jgi:hypothetical protein
MGGSIMSTLIKAGTATSGAVVEADATGKIELQTGSTPTTAITIDASQNVGIGTTSPEAPADVVSNSNAIAVSMRGRASDDACVIRWISNNGSTVNGRLQVNSGGDMIFQNTNSITERMRIDSSGNVCIGTTTSSPGGRLTVITGSDEAVWTRISAGASAANMVAWNDANSGNNYFHAFFTDAAANNVGNIDYNRGAGLVRYNTTSDATLKNILGDSDGKRSIEILNETRIREFAWKNDPTQKPQIGVIAQELHETFAGAVMVGGEQEDGKYRPWGVDKTAFTFHLIAGWQAHEKMIKELKELVEAQAVRIAELEGTK